MLEKVQEDRQNKIDAIRQLGIDPYGGRYETAQPIAKVLETFTPDTPDLRGEAAGRIVLMRDMGKMIFAHIRDWTGQMQICLRKDQPDKPPKGLDEKGWSLAKLLDLGDIVAVEGPMMKTRTGEITIFAEKFTLLCKSLAPMPEKYHGLQDIEIRSRKRYLDLMSNPDSMKTFIRRTEIFDVIRTILKARGYIEVETPMMQSIYGGAAARPFLTHHNALDIDLFMRISPELFLKRLLVGGMERVFEINRNFRNEGIDSRHNPEFTMMELYEAYADYNVMMEIAEEIVSTAAQKVCGGMKLPFGDQEIDYTPPWPRYEYDQLLQQHVGVSFRDSAAVRDAAAKHGLACTGKDDAVLVNELFERFVEPKLATMDKPVFVKDYPAALCPLTRRKSDDPNIALRFECYVAGMELANAYTELNDPAIQEDNFSHQLTGEGGETMRVMDEDFVMALRHGMPPAGGMGIGIDRLVMILTNTNSIRDVILFPLLKPEKA